MNRLSERVKKKIWKLFEEGKSAGEIAWDVNRTIIEILYVVDAEFKAKQQQQQKESDSE